MVQISPSFIIDLIDKIEKSLWEKYGNYKKVHSYMERWQEEIEIYNSIEYNFEIIEKEQGKIDLIRTLSSIRNEKLLFQIAVDLGIEVPGLIYSVAEIKGLLADNYTRASEIFENAYKHIHEDPADAIEKANTALESIIKKICENTNVASCNKKDTLYKLVTHLLKELELYPDKEVEQKISQIGSAILSASQAIEDLRSNFTESHGKTESDHVIDDEIAAKFIINSISTIGLLFINIFEKKYKHINAQDSDPFSDMDIAPSPFDDNDDEIPF